VVPLTEPARYLLGAILLLVVVAGCDGGPSACEQIVDEGLELFQELIDDVDSGTVDDASLFADLDGRAADLDQRAEAAGCTSQEMARLLDARSGELRAESDAGRAFIDLVKARVVFAE
jgi:hypothetical protein